MRETYLRRASGELTVVPNAFLFKNPVEIITDATQRRHQLVVGVAYDSDLEKASSVLRQAIESVEAVDKDKGIDVFATEFGASSIDFLVRWWAGSSAGAAASSTDEVLRSIKAALEDAGIEIPFPHTTHTFKGPIPIAN